uniref:Cationic amino acid transporter C-terminal domain-containing protein n=1 Tax=Stomoxys calcitrans TaxID=35570 RepID=A0A1I8NLY0_STOCA
MVQQPSYWKVLTRRKALSQESGDGEGKLNRVLGLYDLTALGVGSTLGAGVYVLAGQIAKDQAGPSVIISFAIAALASLLAGVCYAEFGARVPKAGSAYIYSYVCIGEFAAFVIGWNLILEYMIGTASVCRGISLYLDTLINDTLKTTFAEVAPMHIAFLGSYFDFFAFGLVVVFGVALAFGVETSAMANNFCTCLNLSILLFVIVAGAIKSSWSNWTIDVYSTNTTNIPEGLNVGSGGFFPFGFSGTLKGAATCFFGFVGFDCIATTGEEVRNPRKNIPRSILLSLLVIFLCYFGVSTVLTLMVPYYLQDANAPLPSAFKEVGWNFAMWIVSIGGLVGLLASLLGALFPLPRIMYSMAQDGLLFRYLGKIHPRYRVPVIGSIFAAILTALIAGLFDLAQLVDLLSIGTLLAYSVVAISITILRYMDNSETFNTHEVIAENGHANGTNHHHSNGNGNSNGHTASESTLLTSPGERVTFKTVVSQMFNFRRVEVPNQLTTRIVGTLITLFCLLSMGIGLIFMQAYDALINNQLWVLVLLIVLVTLTLLVLVFICLQPREAYARVFRVPFVPVVPAVSIFINIYLMLQLDMMTWIRFGVWMVIGVPMFIACWCMNDIKNPANRHPERLEFERMLKSSGGPKPDPPDISGNMKGLSNISVATTVVMQQNECSVKSLDEIMDLNEVREELLMVKHPNGQINYVEETKSDKSQNSNYGSKESSETGTGADTTEEEKSVIAMLDDVLQIEDDRLNELARVTNFYDRKISVDSEMVPSVIRSTTVVTVHSSSSDSSDNDLAETTENTSSARSVDSGIGNYQEKAKLASELVDDILNSPQLWMALEKHRGEQENKKAQMTQASSITPEKRVESQESLLSLASVEDPLHSENFRNKLSRIIMRPPEAKPHKESSANEDRSSSQERPMLKHSKSEADVRKLVLKAIEGCDIDLDEQSPKAIPKPPKFDPVLYKTINSLGRPRERPGLDKLLKEDQESKPKLLQEVSETPDNQAEEIPFKQKLEAILKRGPSHRTQIKPTVELRRPRSLEPLQQSEDLPYLANNPTQSLQSNLNNAPLNNVINETRRTLKSVKKKANDL